MIISNSRKFIFVHLPKTGGTSISHALSPVLRWDDILTGGTGYGEKVNLLYKRRFGLWKHSTAGEIRAVVGDEVWSSYYTFGFVRNPYERMRSLYTYTERMVRKKGWRRYVRHFREPGGLWTWSFVNAYLQTGNFPDFIRHPELLAADVARPMTEFLMEDGKLLVDFVGKQETLRVDFQSVCDRLRLAEVKPGARNVSEASLPLDHYFRSQEDYDYVYDLYRKDFESFGYERVRRSALSN